MPAALLLQAPGAEEPSSHQARFVSVEPNVRLEVLSYGGTGRPIVLLAGHGAGDGPRTVRRWIDEGGRQFTEIPLPVLAIFASPHDIGAQVPDQEFERFDEAVTEWHANQLERGVPGARVLRWPRVSHHFFLTHRADVAREVSAFLAGLR